MQLVNHRGMWLRDDAAESLARFERDHGVQPITSAGRTVAEQNVLIRRYDTGGKYNRPPYLFAPARPAEASRHVADGGTAIDTNNPDVFHQHGAAYGWLFNYAYDKVHFEYSPAKDTKRPVTSNPGARPTLRRGSKGKDVKDLQTILNKYHGTHLNVDGVYGVATRDVVSQFQDGHGLNPDGVVGPKTWAKLGQ